MTARANSTAEPEQRSWLVEPETRVLAHGDTVLVRYGDTVTRCTGQGIREFVGSLLDSAEQGRIDLQPSDVGSDQLRRIERLLDQLVDAGLLTELTGDRSSPDPIVAGLWQRSGRPVSRSEISASLTENTVLISGSGTLVDQVRTHCQEAGLTVADAGSDPRNAALAVVVGANEDDRTLEEWNAHALEKGQPWLAMTPFDGERATVGPWMVPGESACYHCYRLRRTAVFPDEDVAPELAEAGLAASVRDQAHRYPGLTLMQVGLTVDRLIEHIGLSGRSAQSAPGGLTTISIGPHGIDTSRHRVLRVPRCQECSPASGRGFPQVWFGRDPSSTARQTEVRP